MTKYPSRADCANYEVNVMPRSMKGRLNEYHKCLHTVSIGSNDLSVCEIASAYKWAASRFDECCMVIGDYPLWITLRICGGFDEKSARLEALYLGKKFQREIRESVATPIDMVLASEIVARRDYHSATEVIDNLYSDNTEFRQSIDEDAQSFVDRQSKNGQLGIAEDQAKVMSIQYLREEIAIYMVLADQGWLLDIYLGQELPTLAKIISGEIPGAPIVLKRRVNISLRSRSLRRSEAV